MSYPRALTDQQASDLELWYRDFERVGTFAGKCREMGVSRDTARDAIRRMRGIDTKTVRRKLSAFEVDQLADQLLGGIVGIPQTFPVERRQTGEQEPDDTDAL